MCLAIPGKVIKIDGRKAWVKYSKEIREVMLGEQGVKAGDWVLVQMGVVMEVLTKNDAEQRLKTWNELK